MKTSKIIISAVLLVAVLAGVYAFFYPKTKDSYPAYPYAHTLIKTLIVDNDNYKISLKYPFLGISTADKMFDKMIKAETHAFVLSIPKKKMNPDWKYELYVTGITTYFSKDIISLGLEVYSFTGGAHGSTVKQTKLLDIAASKEIRLNDMFVKGTDVPKRLSEICIPYLIKKIGANADVKWIKEGAGPKDSNYTKFMLTPKYLVVFFGQYQVAPYYLGIQEVRIPLKDLFDILRPEFRNIPGGR
jgi:hypothetical protein